MKKYLLLLLLLFVLKTSTVQAAVNPLDPSPPLVTNAIFPAGFANMPIKQIQKLLGKKLSLKEKIGVKVLQWKIKKQLNQARVGGKSNTGKLAFTFALIAIGALILTLFFSSFFILSPIMAILALIFGSKGKREDPEDRKAKAAFTIGWIMLALFLVLIAAILVVFASSDWRFG